MKKIINGSTNICLFCGNEKAEKWVEYERYYECDCEDAKKDREIAKQIIALRFQRPKPKYKIVEKSILIKN